MTFLPIIERELRARARRPGTYWTRLAVGGFGVLLCLIQFSLSSAFQSTGAGQIAFHGLVATAFLLCCGAFLLTADSITSERREGTLGLLFLTQVRGHDVLLGKLGAAGLAGLCAVIVFLPVLMIPVLSGGVTGGESFRKGLVLLDTLFLSLACGLWASAEGEAWAAAIRKAALLLLGILVGPIVIGLPMRHLSPWLQAAAAPSPITGLLDAGDQSFRAAPGPYWFSLGLIHLLGWLLLWRANILVRRSLHEPTADGGNPGKVRTVSNAVSTVLGRRHVFDDLTEPIRWLLSRQRGLRLAIWAGVLVVLVQRLFYPFVMLRFAGTGVVMQALNWPLSLFSTVAMASLFAWVASRFFVEGRRSGELELLLTTPHGAASLVSTHREMLKHLFRWPIVVLLLVILGGTLPMLWHWFVRGAGPWPSGPWRIHYVIMIGLSGVNLYLSVLALCWVGMWFGLKARTQLSAIGWTVGLATAAPSVAAWGLMWIAYNLIRFIPSMGTSPHSLVISWPSSLFLVGYYLLLIRRARRLLGGELRDAEPQPLALLPGVQELWQAGASAVRGGRHWTPA